MGGKILGIYQHYASLKFDYSIQLEKQNLQVAN